MEQVRTATRGGADTVTVDDTSGTELQDVGVDLADAEGGDGRRDRVILNATPGRDDPSVFAFAGVSVVGLPAFIHVEGSEPTDRLTINGRGGDDLLSASTVGDPVIALTLDGGPGADVLFGGDGDDVLIGGPGFDDVQGRKGNDVADLGSTTTASSGTRATATTPSTARAATTSCSSSGPTTPRRSTCRPKAATCACRATSRTSSWTSTT